MKEYKVVKPKLGFRNWNTKYENLLNKYAKEGWTAKFIFRDSGSIIFEHNKNR